MKKDWKTRMKKAVAVMAMACMLLTVVSVNSNEGIMPCGAWIEDVECVL